MLDVASQGCSEIAATYRSPMMGGADEVAKLHRRVPEFFYKVRCKSAGC
jgi:hypothetical protein